MPESNDLYAVLSVGLEIPPHARRAGKPAASRFGWSSDVVQVEKLLWWEPVIFYLGVSIMKSFLNRGGVTALGSLEHGHA